MIFPRLRSFEVDDFEAERFDLSNAYFSNIDCFECTRSPINVHARDTYIENNDFEFINSNSYDDGLIGSSTFIQLGIRPKHTYTVSLLTTKTITETITIDSIYLEEYYGGGSGSDSSTEGFTGSFLGIIG